MNTLQNLNCATCSGTTTKLNLTEISLYLDELSDWKVNEEKNMIFKKIKFKNFNDSLNFANKVGLISNKQLHHPDISIGYGYCLILIHTHAIKGLSINDFILAAKIDLI